MRRLCVLLAGLAVVGVLAGCAVMPNSAILAPVVLDQKSPVAMGDPSVSPMKEGSAKVEGFLIFTSGDASIAAAMREGNITRVHHVDSESMNILGIYARYTTKVYGE